MGGAGLAFGEISIYASSTAYSIPTDTWSQLVGWDTATTSANNTIPSPDDGHIEIQQSGKYFITISAAFSGSGSVTWNGGAFKNNGATLLTTIQTRRKLGAAGDVGSVSMSGMADLEAGDTLEVWYKHDAGVNKDITVIDITLSAVQIGS